MADTETGYQGWRDHATWAVALHIGNDQGIYTQWTDRARELELQVTGGKREDAVRLLEDELREWFDELVDEFFGPATGEAALLMLDLMPRGDAICWREVAEAQFEE